MFDQVRDRLSDGHQRTSLEYVAVLYDPVMARTRAYTSSGMHGAWGSADPLYWAHVLYEHNGYVRRLRDYTAMDGDHDALAFEDIPGGRTVQ